jgi:hypothetical protein
MNILWVTMNGPDSYGGNVVSLTAVAYPQARTEMFGAEQVREPADFALPSR